MVFFIYAVIGMQVSFSEFSIHVSSPKLYNSTSISSSWSVCIFFLLYRYLVKLPKWMALRSTITITSRHSPKPFCYCSGGSDVYLTSLWSRCGKMIQMANCLVLLQMCYGRGLAKGHAGLYVWEAVWSEIRPWLSSWRGVQLWN